MRRLIDFIARRRWLLIVLPLMAGWMAFAFGSSSSEPSSTPVFVGPALILGLVLFVIVLATNLGGRDPDAAPRAAQLQSDPTAQALLTRWLRRSKHFRFVGGAAGVVLGFAFARDGDITPVILFGLAGVAIGGALAEAHSLSRNKSQATSANLFPRHTSEYTSNKDTLALKFIGVSAVGVAVVSPFSNTASAWPGFLTALAAITVASATLLMQRAVVLRPRPALSSELRHADDLMRCFAATLGFTTAAIRVGFFVLAQAVLSISSSDTAGLIAAALWIAGLGWTLFSRHNPESLAAGVAP